MSAIIWVKCPTCGTPTVHHIDEASAAQISPLYTCQECENSRQLKPSELISQGTRKAQPALPGGIQAKIEKQAGPRINYDQ